MSSNDDKSLESLSLSADERRELEAREHRRLEEMAKEVQRRYDPARLSKVTAHAAGRAEKLDDSTRRSMEKRLGGSFGAVRVVRGAFAERVLKRHRADAVTVGSTGLILVRDRANLRSPEGKALLAHELTHVKQAQRGLHFQLAQGSNEHAHEKEAYAEGAKAKADAKQGASGAAGGGGADLEARREKAVELVLRKFEAMRRLQRELSGLDDV